MNWPIALPCLATTLVLVAIKCRPQKSIPCVVCVLCGLPVAWSVLPDPDRKTSTANVAVARPVWEEPGAVDAPEPGGGNAPVVVELADGSNFGPEAIAVGELMGPVGKPEIPRLDLTATGVGVVAHLARPIEDWNALITKRLLDHGGKEGKFTATLFWDTDADLDLWIVFDSGERIGFRNRRARGGELDVDANAGSVIPDPVENITFLQDLPKGTFHVHIDHYNQRQAVGPTQFVLRVLNNGERTLYFDSVPHDPATSCDKPEYTLATTYSF